MSPIPKDNWLAIYQDENCAFGDTPEDALFILKDRNAYEVDIEQVQFFNMTYSTPYSGQMKLMLVS